MTQVLLTRLNSIWGVIINPASSNVYRHVISFDTPEEKKEFINKNLFEGKDYEELLKSQPEISFTVLTATKATFRVNIDDYPEETIYSLVNKDFVIIKEDDEVRFYTVMGVRKGHIIEYTADLDIFFTYDIKKMFNTNDTMINRTHLDRSYKDKNKAKFDFRPESPLLTPEPIGENFNQRISKEVKDINYSFYSKDYMLKGINWKESIDFILRTTYWGLIFEKDSKSYNNNFIKGFEDSGDAILPYKILTCMTVDEDLEVPNGWTLKGVFSQIGTNKRVPMNARAQFGEYGSKPTTLSLQISPYPPLTKESLEKYLTIRIINEQAKVFALEYRDIQTGPTAPEEKIPKANSSFVEGVISDIESRTSIPDFNNKRDIKYESKLHTFPFTSFDIVNSFSDKFSLHPELLYDWDNMKLKTNISTAPEIYKTISAIEKGVYEYHQQDKKHLITLASFQFPLSTSAWESYIANNTVSSVTGQVQQLVNFGSKVTAGTAIGGPAGAFAGATSGLSELVNFYSKRADIQNQPSNYTKMGTGLSFIYQYASMSDKVLISTLQESDKQQVYDYLYKNGYEYNRLGDINKFIDTRYYFNYIKASGVFENIKLQLSGEIKQLINDTLAKGVTIWHMRDLKTFKNIKNYEYENMELKYV